MLICKPENLQQYPWIWNHWKMLKCLSKQDLLLLLGSFQLEFASISGVINHMTCYKFSTLIGWNYSIQTGEQILKRFFKINCPPMRAVEFITGHMIYNLVYTCKFQLKTTLELSLNGTMLPMLGWLWSWKVSFTSLKKIFCLKMRFKLERLGFWMCQDVKNTMFPWRHDKQFCWNFILKSRHCEKATKFEKISNLFWRLLQCVKINPDLSIKFRYSEKASKICPIFNLWFEATKY